MSSKAFLGGEARDTVLQRVNLEVSYCSRCKMKQADFICKACDPCIYFCANCDGYVHSLPSKRNHNRILLENPNILSSISSCSNKNANNIINSNNPNNSFSYLQSEACNHGSKPSNLSLNQITSNTFGNILTSNDYTLRSPQNYINNIKKMYDNEKEELVNKTNSLEKQLDSVKLSHNERIAALHSHIEEITQKNDIDMRILHDQHEMEIKKILTEKDSEIRMLRNHNTELEKSNKELLFKVDEYLHGINETRMECNSKLSMAEYDIRRLEKEIADLKNYYEKRLAYFTDNFSDDKNKMIATYEKNFEKLNQGYKESKEKYVSLINQRENDIQELMASHKKEVNKLNETINKLKSEQDKLKFEQSKLLQVNQELKYENEQFKDIVEKHKNEITLHIKEKKQIEEDTENLAKNYEELKEKNEKLHRLTHGKFKTKK